MRIISCEDLATPVPDMTSSLSLCLHSPGLIVCLASTPKALLKRGGQIENSEMEGGEFGTAPIESLFRSSLTFPFLSEGMREGGILNHLSNADVELWTLQPLYILPEYYLGQRPDIDVRW